jgi:branched-chain amino acid transport system permease protein
MIYLLTQTLNGLFSAALLFLIASGLTLVFGVMRIVNIAHGSFYMLGATSPRRSSRGRSLILGALAAVVAVAAAGSSCSRCCCAASPADLAQMMLTMGLALVFGIWCS